MTQKLTAGVLAVLLALLLLAGCGSKTESVTPAEPTDDQTALNLQPTPEPEASAPLLVTPEPVEETPVPTEEPHPAREELDYAAEDLTASLQITAVPEISAKAHLLDKNYLTCVRLTQPEEIHLSADSPITGLYLVWGKEPPGNWTVRADGWEASYGAYGYLHEFVELPAAAMELTLQVPGNQILCDICAFTDGRLPDYVQVWQPPVEQADLLLFPTHGDDEFLYFGGVIPYYAGELRLKVQVVYLASHSDSYERPHEQLNGLWLAGLRNYPLFGVFPDYAVYYSIESALLRYDRDEVTAYQVSVIRRFQPLVIVGHDVDGEYGHGFHRLNTFCLKDAVLLAADASYEPESAQSYGVWNTPKLYLHLYADNNLSLDFDQPLTRFGGLSAYEVAKQAFAQHKSQQGWGYRVEPKGAIYDSYSFGLYRSMVGPDQEKNDLLENTDQIKRS